MMKKLLCTLLLTVISVGFVNAQADINIQGNGFDIADGSATTSLTNHTDFGDVEVGSSFARVYTIQNTGDAPLTISGAGFDFPPPSQYAFDFIGTDFTIAPGGFTTFSVIFTPSAPGVISTGVTIESNDPDAESDYTYAITANGVLPPADPDINIQGNGFDIADGSATTSLTNHTDFGDVEVGSSFARVYTIQNTGDAPLIISGADFDFPPPSQYAFDFIGTDFTIAPAASTTFSVVFTPSAPGVISTGITIESNDPDAESDYTFAITANGITPPANPDINVQGNGIDIADGDITPSILDDTDFGDVPIGSSTTKIYTIQNTGVAILDISNIALDFPPVAGYSIDFTGTIFMIPPAGFTTFSVTYAPTVLGSVGNDIIIQSNDPDTESDYTFNIVANGTSAVQDINVQGNGIDIADGDITPSLLDDTDFGDVEVGSSSTKIYTIQNTGGLTLDISNIVLDFPPVAGYSIDFTGTIFMVPPSGSTTFSVTYTPTVIGQVGNDITISSNDPDTESTYTFNITANGTTPVSSGTQLLITQYYEGLGPNDNWIEVKNISTAATLPGSYFLCLFADLNGTTVSDNINTQPPDESILIDPLLPGEVALFRRSNALSLIPSASNLGTPAQNYETEVCSFNGNDVILISSTDEAGAGHIDNRSDIIGVIGTGGVAVTWGQNKGIIKGCGTTEVPSDIFDATVSGPNLFINDYIELTLDEVDNAIASTNIALGTQTVGSTTFTTSWDNGTPDRTKNTVISGVYANSNGSFESCNLTISGGASINLDSDGAGSNYILVNEDLTNNGTFTVGDTEALVMIDPLASIVGSITKIEKTTTLNNYRDFTYWSSPVAGADISVFTNTGVDGNRIFRWLKPTIESALGGGWELWGGAMETARGYISEAPIGIGAGQHTVTFTGAPNNGTIPIALGNINDGFEYTDFNVIGNPYPSAIDIDAFILLDDNEAINNNTMDGTIYLWTHFTQISGGTEGDFVNTDYAVYNLSGGSTGVGGAPPPTSNIGSGQSFFVKSIENVTGSDNVFFQNDMRLKGQNTQFFKNKVVEERDRLWLEMTSEQGAYNQILIGFFDEATDGVDRGYDGTKFNGGNHISFYSKIDDVNYAIQGLGTFNQSKEVTLGFDTSIARTFKIAISNIEGVLKDEDVYLVDNALNIVHDLKQSAYEFEITETGVYSERFTLKFNNAVLDIEDLEFSKDFLVINEDNTLRIKANQEVSKLRVFDMLGRLLIDQEPNESDFYLNTTNIKKGTILILNATMQDGSIVSKKGIKY